MSVGIPSQVLLAHPSLTGIDGSEYVEPPPSTARVLDISANLWQQYDTTPGGASVSDVNGETVISATIQNGFRFNDENTEGPWFYKFSLQSDEPWIAFRITDDTGEARLPRISDQSLAPTGLAVDFALDVDFSSSTDVCIDVQALCNALYGTNVATVHGISFRGAGTWKTISIDSVGPATPERAEVITQPDPVAAGDVESFTLNSLPAQVRALFGHGNRASQSYFTLNIGSVTRTISGNSNSAAQATIDAMQPGDVTLIQPGSNFGTVELNSTAGSANNRKWVIGESDAAGSGPTTSTNCRFMINGDFWGIKGVECVQEERGIFSFIEGSYNIITDCRMIHQEGVRFLPQGTLSSPQTVGNLIVGNYAEARTSGDDGFIILTQGYGGQTTAPSISETVIAYNTIVGYRTLAPGKAITDTSWQWIEPYAGGGFIEAAQTYTEIAHNHFIDCVDEVIMSKSDRHWIHDNLFDRYQAGHISLRSGKHKLVTRNIVYTGGGSFQRMAGSFLNGYYNVGISSGSSTGIGAAHAATQSSTQYGRYARRGWLKNNDWRFNFLLGVGNSEASSYIRMLMDNTHEPDYPSMDNVIKQNFLTGPPKDMTFYGSADDEPAATQDAWNSLNPEALKEQQYWGVKNGNTSNMPDPAPLPSSVTSTGFWVGGADIVTSLPPWIGPGSNTLVTLGLTP